MKQSEENLEKWVESLSPETLKDLEAMLAVVIPHSEVAGTNPLGFSYFSIEFLKFSQKGVDEERALNLLDAIRWKTGNKGIAVEDGKIFLTLEIVDLLKQIRELVADRFIEGKQETGTQRLRWDAQNGILRYGDIAHSFQRGKRDTAPRFKFFRALWEERQHQGRNAQAKKGTRFSIKAWADKMEITETAIESMTKDVNRILREKKFPAKIERDNGLLLIVVEK